MGECVRSENEFDYEYNIIMHRHVDGRVPGTRYCMRRPPVILLLYQNYRMHSMVKHTVNGALSVCIGQAADFFPSRTRRSRLLL